MKDLLPDTVTGRFASTWIAPLEKTATIDLDAITTNLLETNLSHLEALRSSIAAAQRKDIADVRHFGNTVGGGLLASVEETISYESLLSVIEHFRNGIAARRTKVSA